MVSSVTSQTSYQNIVERHTRGVCLSEPLTNRGKRIQMVKMLALVILPVIGLWSYSIYLLTDVISTKRNNQELSMSLSFSIRLGQLIHRLQKERDMSVLYLSAIGPETKTFLLTEYMNTDKALEELTSWPVDLDRNKRKEFKTKEKLLMYLAKHRQELNADVNNVDEEIEYYSKIIDVIIQWTYDSIKESKFSTVWRMFVAYQKITTAKEDLGIERALGAFYYANGGFPSRDFYETYNRKVNAFRTSYRSARLYSDFVDYISMYDSASTERNLSSTIYDYRFEIQHSAMVAQSNNSKSLRKAQYWFDNATILLDLLLGLQGTLGNASLGKVAGLMADTTNYMTAYIVILVIVVCVCPIIIYMTENMTSSIQRYLLVLVDKTKELSHEKKRTDSLLYQMVPKQVAEKLKKNKGVDAEFFKSVTILFSDICGFSRITLTLEPMNIVKLLNALYEAIDELLDDRDLYKVETINDSYMVVSGLPERNGNNHSAEIAEFAIALLEMMKGHKFDHIQTPVITLRIGVNTGPCMAGIVGSAMLRYCLFGDTVNTASRMKSYSMANKIHISPTTYLSLKQHGSFVMKKRGSVIIKGKGEMMTYWLVGRKRVSETYISDDSAALEMHSELPGEITHAAQSICSVPLVKLAKMDTENKITARIAPQSSQSSADTTALSKVEEIPRVEEVKEEAGMEVKDEESAETGK